MHGHSIKETRHNIMVGTLSIYLILAVSLGASLAYWYLLAGISTTTTDTFWLFMLWLVVGLVAMLFGAVTEPFQIPTEHSTYPLKLM
jgi:Zn-dependent membrane protease YugP